MNRTNIEWTDLTWNPITGCTRGCPYCYARRMAYRLRGRAGYPQDEPFRPTFHADKLLEPTELRKPSKIFTCSMGEFFDPQVPDLWRELVLDVIWKCKQHTFQVLTKQPWNIREGTEEYWPENLWLGVSIDGVTAKTDLLEALWFREYPHTQFVSFEPLLGPVCFPYEADVLCGLQWVIIGAQTGPGAKQPKREWVDMIVERADNYGVPVFIKDNVKVISDDERRQEWPKGVA